MSVKVLIGESQILVNEMFAKVLSGKRITYHTARVYGWALKSIEKYHGKEWFKDAFEVNAWLKALPNNWSQESVIKAWEIAYAVGNYFQEMSGREPDGRYRFFNVFQDLKKQKPRHKKINRRIFTESQLMDILKACRGEYELLLMSALVGSACRIGELGFDKKDPEHNPGLLTENVGDGFIKVRGKTGNREYKLDRNICDRMMYFADGKRYVFSNDDGSPRTIIQLTNKARLVIQRAGLDGKKASPHTIRHSVASMIARRTKSAMVVQQVLQHDKIDTSLGYIHDVENSMLKDVSTMDMLNVKPVEQLALTVGNSNNDDGIVDTIDLADEMFEKIPDVVKIRPLLGNKDLLLLRSVMLDFSKGYRGDSRIYQCQELLKRIMRKVQVAV